MEKMGLFLRGEGGIPILTDRYVVRKEHGRTDAPQGFYTMAVSCFMTNSKGELFTTLRSTEKDAWPGYWENSGGAVREEESPLAAVVREVYEETGIEAKEKDFLPAGYVWGEDWVVSVFFLKKDADLKDVRLQKGETEDAKWVSVAEYEAMIERGEMCGPTAERYFGVKEELMKFMQA